MSDRRQAADDREEIRSLILRSARLLDEKRYDAFVDLFAEGGGYTLEAESEEIGHRMIWLQMEKEELAALLQESALHVHDMAGRTHMVTVDDIQIDGDTAEARSTFAVFRTDNSGSTEVYAVGTYEDRLARSDEAWQIAARLALSRTRMYRKPTPMPL